MLNFAGDVDTQASVRRANLRRALQLVFRSPGVQTRAGIAKATGLTAATASSLVAELIEERLVVEGEPAASTGGKRATTLSVDAEHHLILALVIRPTDAHLALVALDGTEVHSESLEYDAAGRERTIDEALARIVQAHEGRILIAGVQLPGTTDGRTVLQSVQLGWTDVPLAERLKRLLGIPVILVNDVDAEAIAEAVMNDEAPGYRLFIHIGVGIGAAVTLDGELAPGPRDRAGEIGHVQVEFGDEARLCRCGRRGCLESAASMTAMLGERFSDALDADAIRALAGGADERLFDDAARALARVVKLIAALLDATEVVIGGPVRVLGEPFLDRLRAELHYDATGTADVPVRFADADTALSTGVAQVALTSALGVRWNPAQLRAASAGLS